MQAEQVLDLRRIGCSDLAALLGKDPYREPIDLWHRIVHGEEVSVSEWVQEAGDLGKRLELSVASAVLERKLGEPESPLYRPPSLTPATRDWQRYSLDFVSGLVEAFGELRQVEAPRLLECKVRTRWSLDAAGWGPDGSPDIGERELLQVQGQLEAIRVDRDAWLGTDVPDIEIADVCVLVDGQHLEHHPVRYDPELAGLVRERAEQFWRDYVLTETPPPLAYGPGTMRALQRRFPQLLGDRPAPEEVYPLATRLVELRELRKAAEKEEDELHRRIAELAGQARRLVASDWTWTQTEGEGALRWGELLEALRKRAGLSREDFDSLKNQFRGATKRSPRLNTRKGSTT